MYCTACGFENQQTGRYCGGCGRVVGCGTTPYVKRIGLQAPDRRGQVRLLGIFWLAESALRLVPGLLLLGLFGAGGALLHEWLPFGINGLALVWMPMLALIGAILSLTAVAGAVAGWGLITHKPWARTLALILGLLSLPHVPFGTLLGVYTLYVLLPGEVEPAPGSPAGQENRETAAA